MSSVRTVDFNALPQHIRERLVASFKKTGWPQPILSDTPSFGCAAFGWGFLALMGITTSLGALLSGFGDRRQGPAAILAHGLGAALVIVSVLMIVRGVLLRRSLPFPPGRYMLPLDFIVATERMLKIIPMSSLVNFQGVHQHTNGAYTGTTLTFTFEGNISESITVQGKHIAEQAMGMLQQSQAEVRAAAQARDATVLQRLDPFFEIRMNEAWNQLAPQSNEVPAPSARSLPGFLSSKVIWGIAFAAIPFIGVPLWGVWNIVSDEVMFSKAKTKDSVYGYEDYLYTGKRHENEVRTDLLPKAAFKEAKKKGTVTALRDVLKKYPASVVDADTRKEIHNVFEKTRKDFHEQASTNDARLLPFMDKLIDHLEKNEANKVEVRFHSPSSASLEAVDSLLKKRAGDPSGDGNVIPVAPHFSDADCIARESVIVNRLGDGFAAIFPADIMTLSNGVRIAEKGVEEPLLLGSAAKTKKPTDKPEKPKVDMTGLTVPTIDIRYRVGWAGDIYSESKGTRKFVGIVVHFQVAMVVPGETDVFDFELEVMPPETFTVNYQSYGGLLGAGNDGGPSEGRVYDVMAARAFDQLSSKLQTVFFQPGFKPKGKAGLKRKTNL